MSSIRVTHRGPDGHLVEVPAGVLDLDRRIKEGDATCDWTGDARMYLRFNALTSHYEVWRHCEDNVPRLIARWDPDKMDSRLLRHLGSIDSWRRGADVLGQLDKHNAALEKHHADLLEEMEIEMREILEFALKRSHLPGYSEIKGRYGVGSINKGLKFSNGKARA